MLYCIVGTDVENSLPLRKSAREAHLARLQELHQEGRLILAGPKPAIDSSDPGDAGFTGSLIVAVFPVLSLAQTWAEADPYILDGVYAGVTIKPFKQVFPQ